MGTLADLGAGERDRTADLPFTRSPARCHERSTCTDDTGYRTDCTRSAGIIRLVVPRTVPRGQRAVAVTERSNQNPAAAAST